MKQAVVSMSVGQPQAATKIVKDWIVEEAPPEPEPEPVPEAEEDDIKKAVEVIMERGDKFHVYRGLRHQMFALEDSDLFEFSTQHFDSDSNRIIHGD